MVNLEKGNSKLLFAWAFYDWANSVYNLVISSAIFPIFYDNVTTSYFLENYNKVNGTSFATVPEGVQVTVDFFGAQMSSSVLISYVLSASFLVVSILSPLLSGVADYSGNKKRFLQFFCYFGALACVSLFFFVISSFYMFMPGTTIFKKGMYFTLAGIALVLVMLFF